MSDDEEWAFPPEFQPDAEAARFDVDRALAAVVALEARVPPDAMTAPILGTERTGSAVVIREDGLALTRTLKADAATRDIPVVACTACAMPGDEATMIAAGCQGYLAKPIEVDRFVQQVQAMLPGDAGGAQTQDRQSGTAAAPPRDTAGDARHP